MNSNIKTIPHSVVILINKNNEILLEERLDDGYFDFPGGGVEDDEGFENAARRELLEETGLYADELELFKIYTGDITYYKYWNGNEIYGIDYIYICRNYHGDLSPQETEIKSLQYCPLDKMPEKMSKRNKQIIQDLKSVL